MPDKTKVSWTKCVRFANRVESYIATGPKDTKLKYALQRVLTQLEEKQEEMNLKFNDASFKNALEYTDGEYKGAVMRDARDKLMFSRAGSIQADIDRAVVSNIEIEFEPYFIQNTANVPDGLDFTLVDVFRGFVITNEMADQIVEMRLSKKETEAENVISEVEKPNGKDGLTI